MNPEDIRRLEEIRAILEQTIREEAEPLEIVEQNVTELIDY